ncbi:MAG: polysaccharide biosynthesis/export family protein [Succinivibrionaceae bacterium]|nr:polysaccharide biosynthesis/export family protein [Succinivibrionaceae bacterium]
MEFSKLKPFGAELFNGNFADTFQTDVNPDYRIAPGDRIVVRMWGAKTYEEILTVDLQGNIFIPEIGPIHVMGTSVSSLVDTIKRAVSSVFTNDVNMYVNLQTSQPIAVFITGAVNRPGRYAGSQNDNILSYLDRAGGINPTLGSYRSIQVKRGGSVIKTVDLYSFLVSGEIPLMSLKNDDVIVVTPKNLSVSVYGLAKKPATYEFFSSRKTGKDLLALSPVVSSVSHVQVSGNVNGQNFNKYMSLEDFRNYTFNPDDKIMFVSDSQQNTLLTSVIGPIKGKSRFIVKKGTHLYDVLDNIQIEPEVAEFSSLYVRRKSVAEQQHIIINDALKRLEQSALTAESGSVDEASIRVKEAELIQDFVKRAQMAKPDGIVVVSYNGQIQDLLLEDGDEIIIPPKSSVVQIGGEVMMPKAVVFNQDMTFADYIDQSGGFSPRADEDNILIVQPNGQVGTIAQMRIQPGSRIIVMPRVDTKKMQFAKDIMQIIYQLAVATKVVVGL